MAFIPLDRRFTRWNPSDDTVVNWVRFFFEHNRDLGWDDLLRAKRVVILAEGGTGKSTELEALHHELLQRNAFSFLTAVKKIGNFRFESTLDRRENAQLKEWIDSSEHAWFFVDSIDEAKSEFILFRDALKHIADAISGAEDRAHIIISGRHIEWEAIRDHDDLERLLPTHSQARPSENRPDDLLLRALKLVPDIVSKIERPLVVVMAPLDINQVRTFVEKSGVANVDSFIGSVERAHLWQFASRPVDLDWLIRYWQKYARFGTLAAMLQLSLTDRLREQDPKRERRVLLSEHDAMQALERTGAALVLGKKETINLMDKGRKLGEKGEGISLSDLLSDLPSRDQMDLLNRAVFVPTLTGSTRLHNDNTGTVRAFLCAKWIARLSANNLPVSDLFWLLFATTYDVDVVRPAMRETAAWLAIDNPAVAREIIKRDPLLLMQAGDPSSLPLDVRKQALAGALQALAKPSPSLIFNRAALQRFVGNDMVNVIVDHWQRSHSVPSVALMLLELIEAGELVDCASIVLSAALDMGIDSQSRILAIKALAKLNIPDTLLDYRNFLLMNYREVEHEVLWFAVNNFFPSVLSIDDLIAISSSLSVKDSGRSLDYHGPKLARHIIVIEDALRLLGHFMSKLSQFPAQMTSADFENARPSLNTMKALAVRALELRVPTAQLDLILVLQIWLDCAATRHPVHEGAKIDLAVTLRFKPELRRAWLWKVVRLYSISEVAQKEPLEELWQLRMPFAFDPRLLVEDAAWLLQDLHTRETASEKKISFELLREVCYQAGNPLELVKEIKESACQYSILGPTLATWSPLPIETSSELQLSYEAQQRQAERQSNEKNRSWIDFANLIREHPAQTRKWAISENGYVDPLLIKLWIILTKKSEEGSLNVTPDIKTLCGIFENDVIHTVRDVFINSWRATTPKQVINNVNSMSFSRSYADLIGFAGISLEAQADPDWAIKLKADEAQKAVVYAMFAFDVFPSWMTDLCIAHPQICENVIRLDLARDLVPSSLTSLRPSLARIARSDRRVACLVEGDIWSAIDKCGNAPVELLSSLLEILLKVTTERMRLFQLIAARIHDINAVDVKLQYLAAAFSIDADKSTELLFGLLNSPHAPAAAAIAESLIPKIFGNPTKNQPTIISQISIENLEKLILFTFSSIQLSEDVQRPAGIAFTPDLRDFASRGRQQALQFLAEISGKGSYSALKRLIEIPEFSLINSYMKDLARKRVESDSEIAAWIEADVLLFEKNHEALPRTPAELQRVVEGRLKDLQHDLIHSDFGQGAVVAALKDEKQVQSWFAHEFRKGQGLAFSIEREPLVIDGKEPDYRIRSKATEASLPVEIKVAESWSLPELEQALTSQLKGRYLRDRNDRWGILLLVYQEARPKGWKSPDGSYWSLSEVVSHLDLLAIRMARETANGPEISVCVVDVSSVSEER